MYVYYVDEQSAQWVAVSKSGPKGDKGDTGDSFSGDYNDLTNRPTIPTVGDGTITVKQGGTTKGTFTVNQSGNTEINIDATSGSSISSISDLTDVDTSSSGHVPSLSLIHI